MECSESEHHNRKQAKQPISVPFLWEIIPGTPKRDWKPITQTAKPPPPPPPPIKLIASIPFEWEEKPGKPFPVFSQPTAEFEIPNPPKKPFPLALPPPPMYSQDDNHDNDSGNNNRRDDEKETIFESDSEVFSFEADESFCSVPSLLANCLIPTVNISNAVPVLETPPSYESDSSTSSYATGTTSLVGAPFLERLFPLLSPTSGFPEKVGCSEKNSSDDPTMKVQSKDSDCESNSSVPVRRPMTLGELIMMSRRRSYIRKAVHMRKYNSMGSMKKRAIGCLMFGLNNRIEGLHQRWKKQLRLKLT